MSQENNNNAAGAAGSMDAFFTRGKANEGVQLPLYLPDGSKSEHWVRILGVDSDIFRAAEELGIDSKNVDSMANSPNPDIQRFVGKNGDLGKMLGVSNDWAVQIIRQVGNYGEVFEKHIGKASPLAMDRAQSPNRLARDGGLIFSYPVR